MDFMCLYYFFEQHYSIFFSPSLSSTLSLMSFVFFCFVLFVWKAPEASYLWTIYIVVHRYSVPRSIKDVKTSHRTLLNINYKQTNKSMSSLHKCACINRMNIVETKIRGIFIKKTTKKKIGYWNVFERPSGLIWCSSLFVLNFDILIAAFIWITINFQITINPPQPQKKSNI